MRVLEVTGPEQFSLRERPVPQVEAGEVLVRPLAVGICGSDVDVIRGTRPKDYINYPIVPGHEWVAEVVRAGAGISHVRAGDYVAVEGHNCCRVCPQCRKGATNFCQRPYDEFGFVRDGGLAEFVVVRGDLLHPFNRTLSPEYAALTEPAACSLNGVELAQPQPGETVVIIGPGTIGLLSVALFALHSPRKLIVVGRRSINRDLALALGATDFITGNADEVKRAVRELTDGLGADIVCEAAGNVPAVELSYDLVRRGGRILFEGVAGDDALVTLPADLFILQGISAHGVFAYNSNHFEQALRLIEGGILKVSPLVTHRLPLARYADGLKLLEDKQEQVVKVVILPQE